MVPSGVNTDDYTNGPNQIIPATDYVTTYPDNHVKLRIGARGPSAEPPVSVPGLLQRTVARYPEVVALVSKIDGKWQGITFKQYQDQVRIAAKAFLKLGLERYHSVCILGFNSKEWFISDLAAIHAGGCAAGIYTTNSVEACFHCLDTSRANICVVQDKKQLEKILAIRNRLRHLKAIIQWEQPVDISIPGVYSWEQMMEIGAKEPDTQLDKVLKTIAINECCTLVYTSGTVGLPKAVMLSHDNLTYDAFILTERTIEVTPGEERLVSYLPLSHVAAQMMDLYLTLWNAMTVYFAQPDALKGTLLETLKEVRPTRLLGVPRVWEKIYEKMKAIGASNGVIKQYISAWAKDKALTYHLTRMEGRGISWQYRLASVLVLSKVRQALGLDKCLTCVTGAAPLSSDIKKYFLSLDIPLVDGYGLSESSGAHSFSSLPKFKLDSVGEPLNGVETKFGGAMSVNGPGEILMCGRHVFMGYLNDKEKTKDALDDEGWLHTGDIGKLDNNNFLYITGRLKEILITAGGENVAPVIIEQTIQSELPQINYAILIGDKRKFLSVLLTLKVKVSIETGEPLDELDVECLKWIATLGSKCTTISEIIKTKDSAVYRAIEAGIAQANEKAISNAQKVQKFEILPKDLSVYGGELGPTLKMKRNVIYEKYKDIIEGFYKD